jgi:3-deoxy-manno-octulosonate cytidylyltransferase (CMP-KDO synthetase)
MNKAPLTIVIPARYESSRFPGKPLAQLASKPLIQHVYEMAIRVKNVDQVIVATDDSRIQGAVEKFGGVVQMVTAPCRTGTDRVAEVGRSLSSEVIVNLQADEILLSPAILNDLIDPFLADPAPMGTLKRQITHQDEFLQPSVVKVVTDQEGRALYFSRASIPHTRDQVVQCQTAPFASIHLGVYIFKRTTLLQFAELPTGILEKTEKLEQLRALEHGIPIKVWETKQPSLRIDTPEDLAEANRSWERLMVGTR